jgi:mono/diheme cytochrome c family protein
MAFVRPLLHACPVVVCFMLGAASIVAQEPAESDTRPADQQLARGATLYRIHCASCHGKAGTGDGPVAPALRKKPADLTSIAKRADGEFPVERVRSTIDGRTELAAHGAREMPVWGLSFADPGRDVSSEREIEAEINALVRYVGSLQKR